MGDLSFDRIRSSGSRTLNRNSTVEGQRCHVRTETLNAAGNEKPLEPLPKARLCSRHSSRTRSAHARRHARASSTQPRAQEPWTRTASRHGPEGSERGTHEGGEVMPEVGATHKRVTENGVTRPPSSGNRQRARPAADTSGARMPPPELPHPEHSLVSAARLSPK